MESQGFTAPLEQNLGIEDEWEYEYDTTQLETFHVTLDVSSYNQQPLDRHGPVAKPKPSSSLQEQTATSSSKDNIAQTAHAVSSKHNLDPSLLTPDDHPIHKNSGERIQILELHTQNPLISYEGQLYSCDWGTTIGTDVILQSSHRPNESQSSGQLLNSVDDPAPENAELNPRVTRPGVETKKGDSLLANSSRVNIKAITNLKLLGRPVVVTPSKDATPSSVKPYGEMSAREKQVDFLRRLKTAKHTRGEKEADLILSTEASQSGLADAIHQSVKRSRKA